MPKASLDDTEFKELLERACVLENADDCFSLTFDETQTWLQFAISGVTRETPSVRGHYVENGDSYWQIESSGRETYTGERFIEEIRFALRVLRTAGCTEKRWRNRKGELVRSMILLKEGRQQLHFGKSPPFWRRNLVLEEIEFLPYCSSKV